MTMRRREMLIRAAWLAGVALTPAWGLPVAARSRFQTDPFSLGVASGDPAPDGVVLWTRLAPQPLAPDGGMPPEAVAVAWEVADDEGFQRVVAKGKARAEPQAAHTVHVEVEGLRPGRTYFYRFHAAGETSPVGRTRTAPAPGADVQRLRYAFTACQQYEAGFYAGYRQMVADDPELIFFLGDYIYEGPPRNGLPRRHNAVVPVDLASYRQRIALYKTDKHLQAAHAAAPWLVIWDDHEVHNNYGGDHPPDGVTLQQYLSRRAAAYQAYYEHMPLRRRSKPVGPAAEIYRTLDWGRLAQFQLLDGRQYRDAPPRQGEEAERLNPARSMLGARQEAWLVDQLSASRAQWNVLAQQFMMGEARRPDPKTGEVRYSLDGWDGFPAARDRVLTRWRDASVSNPMAIGGDSHAFIASDLGVGPDGPVVAPAFVGGSMTSGAAVDISTFAAASPRVRFGESTKRGYSIVDVDRGRSLVTMRAVADAKREDSPVGDLKQFVVENGVPGFREA